MTDSIRGGAVSKFNILNDADLNHAVQVETGLMEEDCKAVMQRFFQALRQRSKDQKKSDKEVS
jgi:tRNA(adenine34) deaminase